LLRWRHYEALHACLDRLSATRPDLVSLLDLRARAFTAERRYTEAIEVMQRRLDKRSSLAARALLGDIYLAQGELARANEVAASLAADAPDMVTTQRLVSATALARGDHPRAAEANQRLAELRPDGRAYLLSMMAYYRARDDWVTASGYAVRLLNTAERPEELSVVYLRKLLDYFRASQEETRARQIEEAIEARHGQELSDLQEMLGFLQPRALKPKAPDRPASDEAPPTDLPPGGTEIAVSDEEEARIRQAVERSFGFTSLLPGQLETIACVMRGENALTVLPTGGGKSLCYQVPALTADDGLTVVISPLIALMKDQVDSLPAPLRPYATTINSSLDGDVLRRRLRQAAEGRYRLLYAAPERLRQPTFLHTLSNGGVHRLVVDEAHCVSVWGHDFRPDYLKLAEAWEALGRPPILALTATAPPRVRRDIIQHLSPGHPMATVTGNVIRENLHLEVFFAANRDEKTRRLIEVCANEAGSGIVYADTRARCEQLAFVLRQQGVDAAHYHAGIPNRAEVQEAFMEGRTRVIVATIAFGMGIDKPDIRFIIHYMPPSSLESYYQEAGRAGRDGHPARCLLMYSHSDHSLLTRRMRRGLPTIELLRNVYATVMRYMGTGDHASIAPGDLERDLQIDDTPLRVALSILEENGLLRRGPDTPRAALVRLRPSGYSADPEDGTFRRFTDVARLRAGQWIQLNPIDVAERAQLAPETIEDQLLTWSDEGRLDVRFSGRNLLLSRLPAPDDVAQRISLWLDRYATVQEQRVEEIVAYARTPHCRHGYLSAYLGGPALEHCTACDNCVDLSTSSALRLPSQRDQLATILECLDATGHGWGFRNLGRILRGEPDAPEKAKELPGFGALSFRSRDAVKNLIQRLLDHKLLATQLLSHGGSMIELTQAGKAALANPASLEEIAPAPARPTTSEPAPEQPIDEALFEQLRAWRLAEAKAQSTAPFVIFHNSVLRRIAAAKPRSKDTLLAIKGVGSRKLARYGDAILTLVKEHESKSSPD
ncbi:MAG: RecQ family ATP-dependent DNA helicase, partial [Anaerolineae bacterium]